MYVVWVRMGVKEVGRSEPGECVGEGVGEGVSSVKVPGSIGCSGMK